MSTTQGDRYLLNPRANLRPMDSSLLKPEYLGDMPKSTSSYSDGPLIAPSIITKGKDTRLRSPSTASGTKPKVKRLKREEDQTEATLETKDPDLTSSDANSRLQTALDDLTKTQEKIAKDEAKVLELKAKEKELSNEVTLLQRKPKLEARKTSMLDIEDWEVRYLATSRFDTAGLRARVSQWVEGREPPATGTIRHIKTVLFDALTEIDDEQLLRLLERMQKHWK